MSIIDTYIYYATFLSLLLISNIGRKIRSEVSSRKYCSKTVCSLRNNPTQMLLFASLITKVFLVYRKMFMCQTNLKEFGA